MKKIRRLLALILTSLLISGMACSAFASEAYEPLPDTGETSDVLEISINPSISKNITINTRTKETILRDDLGGRQFGFSSGAGSWYSEMTVYADGTFEGSFHYSYPQTGTAADGSYYMGGADISEFSGKFAAPEKINDYTYSTSVESLSYQNPVGTQVVIDGVLYSYVEAYGISEGDEFLIYLPNTPLSALPDEAIADHPAAFTNDTYAGCYILDNETGFGFYIQAIDS